MKLVLQQIPNVRGDARKPYLSQEAALSLISVEMDTGGLVYRDMWRDSVASLLVRRTRKGSLLPGYSSHNYGIAIDIDVGTILNEKKIRYEDLLWLMKRRGWYCFRKDGAENQTGSEHFDFLGENAEKYLAKSTQDPATWQNPAEFKIWELYNQYFQLETKEVQVKLATVGFFTEPFTGQRDIYTREAILAFQRAWDLIQSGSPDMTLCRTLAFVTAEIHMS